MSALAIGDAIPAAKLIDADGATIDLAGLKGAPLVVYFYPKADTPGCTVEAQDFTRLARSEEHTSEPQSLMRISYAVFCLKKKKNSTNATIQLKTPTHTNNK